MMIEELVKSSKVGRKIAEKILCYLLGLNSAELFLKKNDKVSPAIFRKFKILEKKIIDGFPFQYAIGKAEFYSREFFVDKNVLIPRPETELIVECAVRHLQKFINSYQSTKPISAKSPQQQNGVFYRRSSIKDASETLNIIDIGTGSGCITISLYEEIVQGFDPYKQGSNPNIKLLATDINKNALKIAKKNAKKHYAKIKFYKSDLFSNKNLPKKFGLILANLPYLKPDYKGLEHEPRLALDGGKDGLRIIEKLICDLPNHLNQNGLAILEIDPSQKTKISRLTKSLNLKTTFKKDLNHRTRLVLISIQ